MKKLFVLVFFAFIGYAFIVNQNFRNSAIDEFNDLASKAEEKFSDNTINDTTYIVRQSKSESGSGASNNDVNNVEYSDAAKKYFNEICYGSEHRGRSKILKRWRGDVKIYVEGDKKSYLMTELNTIVNELNSIINPIDIRIVNNKSQANYVIYFCSGNEYVRQKPAAKNYINNNWGLFFVSSMDGTIYNGSMYVDIYRCKTYSGQKHLLREELTQSLGLMNDSYSYSNSIFYQGWTETTSYAPIDIEIIEMLYN